MQLRIKLFKTRKAGKSGTLICSKCGRPHQFALYHGGLCKHCYTPEELPVINSPKRVYQGPPPQSEETRRLRAECANLMAEYGLTKYGFVLAIGLKKGSFDNWWNGRLHDLGQRRMNTRIRICIDRFLHKEARARGRAVA